MWAVVWCRGGGKVSIASVSVSVVSTHEYFLPPQTSFRGSEVHACNHTSSRLEIIYIKSFMKASTINVMLKKSRTFYPMFCSEMHSEPSFIWHFQVETFGYKKLWMGFQLIVAHCSRAAVAGVHLLLFLAAAAIVSPEYIWNNSPHSPRSVIILFSVLWHPPFAAHLVTRLRRWLMWSLRWLAQCLRLLCRHVGDEEYLEKAPIRTFLL